MGKSQNCSSQRPGFDPKILGDADDVGAAPQTKKTNI